MKGLWTLSVLLQLLSWHLFPRKSGRLKQKAASLGKEGFLGAGTLGRRCGGNTRPTALGVFARESSGSMTEGKNLIGSLN